MRRPGSHELAHSATIGSVLSSSDGMTFRDFPKPKLDQMWFFLIHFHTKDLFCTKVWNYIDCNISAKITNLQKSWTKTCLLVHRYLCLNMLELILCITMFSAAFHTNPTAVMVPHIQWFSNLRMQELSMVTTHLRLTCLSEWI